MKIEFFQLLDTIALTVGALVTDVKELKIKQQKTNQRLDNLEHEVQTVKAIAIRMENDHGKHLTNLYDAFQVNKDKDEQLEPRVENLEAVTEQHSLEIISLQNAI